MALAMPPGMAPGDDAPAVRLTVELDWSVPAAMPSTGADSGLVLGLTGGRVIEALPWPAGTSGGAERRPDGGWRLGPGRSGRARARIEAPTGSSLVLRAGGQEVRVPIVALLEGPQRTPAQAGVEIGVERLPWDALSVRMLEGDGMVAPGENVAVAIGLNFLTPEPAEVVARSSAELRPVGGGEPCWRDERVEVVATNPPAPATRVWNVPAPKVEGTYVLEVRSTWEPAAGTEGTRLGRFVRRRRNQGTGATSTRRVSLVVVGPAPAPESGGVDQDVDTIDLTRLRHHRPSASGRTPPAAPGRRAWPVPEAALVEGSRRDRLRGWIARAGAETANLAAPDPSGLAWSALGLKVSRPGRPHRLTMTITGGHPSALGVAMVAPGGTRGRPRVVLDACASGPPILPGGPAADFSWLVWPDSTEPVLVLVNRGPAATVQVGSVRLTELAGVPATPVAFAPAPDQARVLGLRLEGTAALDRFGGGGGPGPADLLATANNLARYMAHCGASAVVLPEGLADRSSRGALDGQAAEDAVGPDRLDLLLRILGRQGCSAWLEPALSGPLPGLPPPGSAEALARGLVRVDRGGQADGPAYHPLHPEVAKALRRRVAEALAPRRKRPSLTGLLIRLGPGPTLLGGPDTGLDDATFARFVRETFEAGTGQEVPGLGTTDPGRFAARAQFLAGSGRMPWLTWRSRGIAALYAELAEAARDAAPGAVLAVATPGLDDGPAGAEARRVDLAGLAPSYAWRAVGLDLEAWPGGAGGPIVMRGVGLSTDDLAHDLATSPDLDAHLVARPARGLLLGADDEAEVPDGSAPAEASIGHLAGGTGVWLSAAPMAEGPAGDEAMGHALAALDARWAVLSATAVAGQEERVRRFARVFLALPASATTGPPPDRQPFGVAARTHRAGPSTFVALANDTPYPIRLETVLAAPPSATVDDLGRGLRLVPEVVAGRSHVVLDLPPFGVAAIRVGAPKVELGSVTPYPSKAVIAGMKARFDELSGRLARLNGRPASEEGTGSGSGTGPTNPGFEPGPSRVVELAVSRGAAAPDGWQVAGDPANRVEIDREHPHSGRSSLRLDARVPPASAVGDRFHPSVQSSLTAQAWLHADRPDAKVRVWIEGEAAGRPFVRRSELSAGPGWAATAVRVADLPAEGLDNVRLRFEMMTAGSLWIDDLDIAGETLSEPERLNARNALLAAMHAYRERRYADFARLAGSHWTRHAGGGNGTVEGDPAESAGMLRTGDSTPLPPARRLR